MGFFKEIDMDQNDKNKDMRGADIVISIIFLILGIFILIGASQMPLTDSYGGVDSVWYVSPALMPIIIGIAIILLSISILSFALKQGGMKLLKESIAERKKDILFNESMIRMLATLIPLFWLVFVHLRMLDFCIAVALYLTFTISVFYFEDSKILKETLKFYCILMIINLLFRVTTLNIILDGFFVFTTDILATIELIVLIFYIKKKVKASDVKNDLIKKYHQALSVSLITPIAVAAIFRFALRIPMPKEGFIMNFMYLIYYAIK